MFEKGKLYAVKDEIELLEIGLKPLNYDYDTNDIVVDVFVVEKRNNEFYRIKIEDPKLNYPSILSLKSNTGCLCIDLAQMVYDPMDDKYTKGSVFLYRDKYFAVDDTMIRDIRTDTDIPGYLYFKQMEID